MNKSAGEMPFLDHLEELRGRIIRALIAVFAGVGVGLWVVTRYNAVAFLKAPIAPYLPGGKLTILAPTEQVMVVLKLGIVLGLVLASPVIIYQLWAFLSPALYDRERKAMMPSLGLGLLLFLLGAWLGWIYGVPLSLKFLLTFNGDDFVNQITFGEYFSFVIQVVLAVGISFELPLIMTLLAWVGVMDAKRFSAFRRYAILLNCIAGAVLSPGTDVVSMLVTSAMLVMLYELGVIGAFVVQKRRRKAAQATGAVMLLALLAGGPMDLHAQNPPVRPPQSDSGRARVTPGQGIRSIDSSTAKRLGIPAAPQNKFIEPDSVMRALLEREGFAFTRFRGDSATLLPGDEGLILGGHAATARDTSVLEADEIRYSDARCELSAKGEPRMFEDGTGNGKILVGREMKFDTCHERGVIGEALTTFDDGGANWFLRGNLAVDSTGKRLYAAHSEFTSCDLAEPHYHFQSGQVKWVSQSVLVARPAVLYVRDVPIVWMPFLFQDTKVGRRSGILIPNFGFNDIVRPTRSYNRQVTNMGYYWAPNDYIDATVHLDWYANRYMQYGGQFRYRWRDRFLDGDLAIDKQQQSEGGGSTNIRWFHNQQFNNATSLRVNFSYVGNTRVLQGNTVDPLLSTQEITSSLNLTKRFRWGQTTLGATRRQTLSDGSVRMSLPTISVSPKPFEFGRHITWSPNLSFSNDLERNTTAPSLFLVTPGRIDTLLATGAKRTSLVSIGTPIAFGRFTWNNTVSYTDIQTSQRRAVTQRVPDASTPDPIDSVSVTIVRNGDIFSSLDWNTGINLPILFQQTLKIQPTLGITNVTSGAFLVRNAATNGQWVQQGKKLQLSLAISPQLFGFLSGVGPVARFRHSIQPLLNVEYSPTARLSEEYARALSGGTGVTVPLETPPVLTARASLNQTLSAKMRRAATDTSSDDRSAPKVTLLQLNTSQVAYDFEQAKLPGRTGWLTPAITNSLQSDLIRGLQLSLTHDLWEGQVGSDTAKFAPFLSNVNASVSLTGGTFRALAGMFGLAKKRDARETRDTAPPPASYLSSSSKRFRPGAFSNTDAYAGLSGRGFTASLNYSLLRRRATGTTIGSVNNDPNDIFFPPTNLVSGNQSNLGLSTSFSPTRYWSVSWQTQYNITASKFESQTIRLQRDLHDWTASFDFAKTATGNFALFFSVTLKPLPDVKFDYNQTTLKPR